MSLMALGPMVSRDSLSDSGTPGERREVGMSRGRRWVFTIPDRIYDILNVIGNRKQSSPCLQCKRTMSLLSSVSSSSWDRSLDGPSMMTSSHRSTVFSMVLCLNIDSSVYEHRIDAYTDLGAHETHLYEQLSFDILRFAGAAGRRACPIHASAYAISRKEHPPIPEATICRE